MVTEKIFNGVRVVELAGVLAGPLAGSFFAELGAEVIKIENKVQGGDVTRQWKVPEESPETEYTAYYCAANFQKKIEFLDFTQSADLENLEVYLSQADMVISNFQKRVAEKYNLGPDQLLRRFPKMIVAQLNAYDYDDPRPGYDLVMQAETGFISMNGTEQGDLCKIPVALMDVIAAHQIKEAVLLAWIRRLSTGLGCVAHISLYKSALSALANQASNYLMAGHLPAPMGTLHPNIAPYGDVFESSDATVFMLCIGSDKQFQKMWDAFSRGKPLPENYSSNHQRLQHRKALQMSLKDMFLILPFEKIRAIFEHEGTPYSIIKNLEMVFKEKSAQEMVQFFVWPDGTTGKGVRNIAFSLSLKGS